MQAWTPLKRKELYANKLEIRLKVKLKTKKL